MKERVRVKPSTHKPTEVITTADSTATKPDPPEPTNHEVTEAEIEI